MLQQLKTQTQAYWQDEFGVSQHDLEFIYSLLIETGTPLTSTQIAHALIEQRLEEEINQIRISLKRGPVFQPQDTYAVGEGIVFPALDNSYGTVVVERPGYNPEYGAFSVMEVQIEGEDKTREFASDLKTPHKLNWGDSIDSILSNLSNTSSDEIFALHGSLIEQKLEETLNQAEGLGFIQFGQFWYLKGLLADVHLGHRNIIEAVLEVNGTSLGPPEILEHVDLPSEISAEAQLFSLNYALQEDDRFDDVGDDQQVLWFLRRLEPPEAQYPPRRLLGTVGPHDRSVLTEDLLHLEKELNDELSEVEWTPSEVLDTPSVSFVLTYPHRRVGTIPLTNRIQQILPKGTIQHTQITLVDGQTREQMPAWVMHQYRYIYGLDEWYKNNKIMVGSYITLEKTDDPFTIIINFLPKREKREWIRVAKSDDDQLRFEMKKRACRCEYDELMVVGEDEQEELDTLWVHSEEDRLDITNILQNVFMELAKLSPQGAVHAKTLYSAANIVRRCPPGPIFAALVESPNFSSVGDGYWLYDDTEL